MKPGVNALARAALFVAAAGVVAACSNQGEVVFGARPSIEMQGPSGEQLDPWGLSYNVNEDYFARSKIIEAPKLILSNKKMGKSVNVVNAHKIPDLMALKAGDWVMWTANEIVTSTTVRLCKVGGPPARPTPTTDIASIDWPGLCSMTVEELEMWKKPNNSLRDASAK